MTPEEIAALLQQPNRQQALLDVLRGKQALGYTGQLTGDRVLAPFGANLQREANSGLEDAQARPNAVLGRALEMARLQDQERRTKAYELASQKAPPNPDKAAADLENLKLRNEVLKKTLARGKGKGKGAAGAGKLLPATTVEGLAELPVAEKAVDDLVGTFGRLNMGGAGGRLGSAATSLLGLQGTDSAEYNAAAKLAMQAAGKILEGGKLAAGDEVKYAAMLPRAGDAPDVVAQKAQGMKAFLRDLASRRSKGLKAAGYNVPDELIPQDAPAQAKQQAAAPDDGKPWEALGLTKEDYDLLREAGDL